jgi:hypothetical protein
LPRGVTQIEVIVASTLVASLLGLLCGIGFPLRRIEKETLRNQVALHELANHMDRLTSIPADSLDDAMKSLQLSEDARRSLPDAQMASRLERDAHGTRLILELQWHRPGNPPALQLVGWIDSDPADREAP